MFRATMCPSSGELTVSLHVSGNYVPIIRRTYCIYATLVFSTLEQVDSFKNYKVLRHKMQNIIYKRVTESQ